MDIVEERVEFLTRLMLKFAWLVLPATAKRALLNPIVTALLNRFEQTVSTEDLDLAIAMTEGVITSTPDHHPNRGEYLNKLGGALEKRFNLWDSMDDVDRAISMYEQAITCTPNDHPERGRYLETLGGHI
jgi:hypothetical protein